MPPTPDHVVVTVSHPNGEMNLSVPHPIIDNVISKLTPILTQVLTTVLTGIIAGFFGGHTPSPPPPA